MAKVNKQAITWCWELTYDVNGRPSREFMPYEIALKGLVSDEQGIGRQQFNELFYQFGQAIVTVEEGYEEAVSAEADARSQADNALQQNINQEVSDRQQADQTIQENLDREIDFLNQDLEPLTGALAQAIMQQLHPVGSVWTTAGNQNPATQLGFGTWTKRGGFVVGQEDGDADFGTAGNTGGSKDHTHTFSDDPTTSSNGGENLTIPRDGWGVDGVTPAPAQATTSGRMMVGSGLVDNTETLESLNGAGNDQTVTTTDHTHTVSVSGTTGSSSNLPPYRVYNVWERTA